LTKPYKNEELTRVVAKAMEISRLYRQNLELKAELAQRHSFGSLIGKSKPMLLLYQLLEKTDPSKANVLITGESGTGKELVARAVHYNSPRAAGAFVAVNCSALSESLLESELFGYEKGAFTGAGNTRAGRFELAHKGTLFLDEIGDWMVICRLARHGYR
jgi:DNA-binding NtrC family response regulator